MTNILKYLGFTKQPKPSEDRLYKFVKETTSREQVKILKKAVLKANQEQRAVMQGK